jgi:hypothetical protein
MGIKKKSLSQRHKGTKGIGGFMRFIGILVIVSLLTACGFSKKDYPDYSRAIELLFIGKSEEEMREINEIIKLDDSIPIDLENDVILIPYSELRRAFDTHMAETRLERQNRIFRQINEEEIKLLNEESIKWNMLKQTDKWLIEEYFQLKRKGRNMNEDDFEKFVNTWENIKEKIL